MRPFFIMILLDGIGIAPNGSPDPLRSSLPWLRELDQENPLPIISDGWAVPTRADLGVPGLPQSGTGHTAILTGVNAALAVGRHVPGFPTPTLKRIIQAGNLLKRLNGAGFKASYVNALRPTHPIVRRKGLQSASTLAALSSGERLRGLEDIKDGRALHHDFTNQILIEQGEILPSWSPKEAGRRLARMALDSDLVLFEYFMTDLAGHSQDLREAHSQLGRINEFIQGLLEEADLTRGHLLVCSDHGNLEDLSVRTHTRNPVPTLIWGPQAHELAKRIGSIEQIAPTVLNLMHEARSAAGATTAGRTGAQLEVEG